MKGTIESAYHPELTEAERTTCIAGGGLLFLFGLSRRSWFGAGLTAVGASLVYRGLTGESLRTRLFGSTARQRNAPPWRRPIRVERSIVVEAPRQEVYSFWRRLENLPRFMTHLKAVTDMGDGRSIWVAKGLGDSSIEWQASLLTEIENEQLSWESLPGSELANKGSVRFQDSPDGGTSLRVSFEYLPPAGALGAALATWLGEDPQQKVDADLQAFKRIMETQASAIGEAYTS